MKEPSISLLSRQEDTVHREIYEISYQGETYTYIDSRNPKTGDILETSVQDLYGNFINDLEIVQNLIYWVSEKNLSSFSETKNP